MKFQECSFRHRGMSICLVIILSQGKQMEINYYIKFSNKQTKYTATRKIITESE